MNWIAPEIPSRLRGWEKEYLRVLAEQGAVPFAWGSADCLTRVADMCAAITGLNPLPDEYRQYDTEFGAMKQLLEMGYLDIVEALGDVFEPVPVALARRGDCGVGRTKAGLSTFIVTGVNALGANERGRVVVPALALEQAFRIG